MTSLTGVAWNRTHSECCPLIGVRVAGVEITESVSHWYFEVVDWGNVYVHVVKYGESVLAVRNQKGLKGYFLKRKKKIIQIKIFLKFWFHLKYEIWKKKNSNHNFLKILILSEIWTVCFWTFVVKGNDKKVCMYKCDFGRGVMYLVFHTTLFLNDRSNLYRLIWTGPVVDWKCF